MHLLGVCRGSREVGGWRGGWHSAWYRGARCVLCMGVLRRNVTSGGSYVDCFSYCRRCSPHTRIGPCISPRIEFIPGSVILTPPKLQIARRAAVFRPAIIDSGPNVYVRICVNMHIICVQVYTHSCHCFSIFMYVLSKLCDCYQNSAKRSLVVPVNQITDLTLFLLVVPALNSWCYMNHQNFISTTTKFQVFYQILIRYNFSIDKKTIVSGDCNIVIFMRWYGVVIIHILI